MSSWFEQLDLVGIQEQLTRSIEGASEIMSTVQRLDLLNLDEMANEQEKEVTQFKRIDDSLEDNSELELEGGSPLKQSRNEERVEEISIPIIPTSVLFDNFDSYHTDYIDDGVHKNGNDDSFWGQSDSLLGFLAPVVNDQVDSTNEDRDEAYHSIPSNEFRIPKRVLTTISQNFSFFENLDNDERLIIDPILKKVEENKATPKKLLIKNESKRVVIQTQNDQSTVGSITFSDAIMAVFQENSSWFSKSSQSIASQSSWQYALQITGKAFYCAMKTLIQAISITTIFFFHGIVNIFYQGKVSVLAKTALGILLIVIALAFSYKLQALSNTAD